MLFVALIIVTAFMMASIIFRALRAPPSSRGRRQAPPRPAAVAPVYVPFSEAVAADAVVCDCTHPQRPTFTHHKGHRNPPGVPPADTSTGLVLNALASGAALPGWLDRPAVTVNHFDGDALFSAWSVINRGAAAQHDALLRAAAALHDFREMPPLDGPDGGALAHAALQMCCWVNSVERQQFTPPYDDRDADGKFAFFLVELDRFLNDPGAYEAVWRQEYDRVLAEHALIAREGAVRRHAALGLAVVAAPRPVHYYALFSHTVGADTVLAVYDGRRYELESKYTQFVNVHSRAVVARLDLGPLAALLNDIDVGRAPGTAWTAPSMVDTGPQLRLDDDGQKLTKGQRYGHPPVRPIHASGLEPAAFEGVVVSFFEHGLRGVAPKRGGWAWDELQTLNAGVDWLAWAARVKSDLGVP